MSRRREYWGTANNNNANNKSSERMLNPPLVLWEKDISATPSPQAESPVASLEWYGAFTWHQDFRHSWENQLGFNNGLTQRGWQPPQPATKPGPGWGGLDKDKPHKAKPGQKPGKEQGILEEWTWEEQGKGLDWGLPSPGITNRAKRRAASERSHLAAQ